MPLVLVGRDRTAFGQAEPAICGRRTPEETAASDLCLSVYAGRRHDVLRTAHSLMRRMRASSCSALAMAAAGPPHSRRRAEWVMP